ncbi:hypothetical protein N8E89_19600 (plasmid) [Phyllobacterium sp. A18/5-2]|nr:hypothetical protein [Phyllobacterium sp. A18/5-2]UXN66803.1 hypothetical protein N8E89_19600 [Phyllobacterium sp. A18/5-2]
MGAGDDIIRAGGGHDSVDAGAGDDTLWGGTRYPLGSNRQRCSLR